MEEIINVLRNGLSAESLEVSLPYLEPFNSLVDYESELEYSSPDSHRDRQRRLAQNDTKRKFLTQLSKNPTEFEKELRSLVLKLYSAEESGSDKTAEQNPGKSPNGNTTDLAVVSHHSPQRTAENLASFKSRHCDFHSNHSVAWSSSANSVSSTENWSQNTLPSLTLASPQSIGLTDCKTGSAVEASCDFNATVVCATDTVIEEKNKVLTEPVGVNGVAVLSFEDKVTLRGDTNGYNTELCYSSDSEEKENEIQFESPVQSEKKGENTSEPFILIDSDPEEYNNQFVNTSSRPQLPTKDLHQTTTVCEAGSLYRPSYPERDDLTKLERGDEVESYSKPSLITSETLGLRVSVDKSYLEGDNKELSVDQDSKNSVDLFSTESPSAFETAEELSNLGAPSAAPFNTSVAKVIERVPPRLPSIPPQISARKKTPDIPAVSDSEPNQKGNTYPKGLKNAPSFVNSDDSTIYANIKDDYSVPPFPFVNKDLPLDSKDRLHCEDFADDIGRDMEEVPSEPPGKSENRARRLPQSSTTQAPTSQGVCRDSPIQDPVRPSDKVTETLQGSDNGRKAVTQDASHVLATQVNVLNNQTWPGGARKTHFKEGDLPLHRKDSDSFTTRSWSLSDSPLTPVFDDSGIRLEFSGLETDRHLSNAELEEQAVSVMAEQAVSGMAEHSCATYEEGIGATGVEFGTEETKRNQPESYRHSNTHGTDTDECPTLQGEASNQSNAFSDLKNQHSMSSMSRFSPLYSSTPAKPEKIEDVTVIPNLQEMDRNKQLQYEKANLEGRLETLQKEYSEILDQRKILQSKLQTMEGRLKCELEKSNNTESDNGTSEDAMNELEKVRAALESQVMELLKAHHEKETDLTEMHNKLAFSNQLCQKLQEKISNLEAGLADKEQVITALRLEMEGIRRDLAEAQKRNDKFTKQQAQLTSDVASLIKAKEWFQKQLSATQDARLKLQMELSDYETTVANQNKIIEQTKCDKARTSRMLMETQQRAMEGKSEILQNLEKVEEEMLQREAAFKQIQADKEQTEKLLAVEVDHLRKENEKLQKLSTSSLRLENELETLKTDIVQKETTIRKLESEKDVLSENLREARQVNASDKYQMISLKVRFQELEKNLGEANKSLKSNEEYNQKLVDEKQELEQSLKIANEEKIAFDSAVQTLKIDLGKVDRRFKLMQRELAAKKSELEQVQGQNEAFIRDLDVLRTNLDRQQGISNDLRDELKEKDAMIVKLQSEKRHLEAEIASFKDKVASLEHGTKAMERERRSLQQQLLFTCRNVTGLEGKLQSSLKEKARLEGLLESTQKSAEEEINSIILQNNSLKQEVTSMQQNSQKEISLSKAREATLERQLEERKDELSDKLDKRNFEFNCIKEELQLVKECKETAEKELQRLHKVTELSVRELKKKYEGQCSQIRAELDSLLEERNRLADEHEEFKEQSLIRLEKQAEHCCKIEQELEATKTALDENKHEIDQMHFMAIELEREKGRLAGVLSSQKTLRQHSIKLEETIAQREAEINELTSEVERLQKEKELQDNAQRKRIAILESNLKSQRDNSQHLQSSLNMEKRESVKLRLELQEKGDELEQLEKELKATVREVKDLEDMYKRASAESKLHQSKLEGVVQELEQSHGECEMLERELSEFTEHKRIKDEQISSLDWETSQRSREVEYLKDQMRMSEERQQMEIENMKTAVQVARTEVSTLRSELADARKSKASYQNEVFKLKDRLLAARQETDLVRDELFKKYQEHRNLTDAVISGADLSEIREEFLAKGVEDSYDDQIDGKIRQLKSTSKMSNGVSQSPSVGLGLCMQSLRSQIASLQKQMNEHTDYIQIATSSWRSFQENVKKLQEVKHGLPSREAVTMSAEKDT